MTSFYFWKTVFKLSKDERSVLAGNGVRQLYVRYCDVVLKDGVVVPESPIVFAEEPKGMTVVPVIFIKNEVMLQPGFDVRDLAAKVVSFVDQINAKHNITANGIQIDCDWSDKSQSNYFRFLESVRANVKTKLSCTIRLHQVKYRERTGVPPVDHGVLMYYNMGHIGADEGNSIYERTIANRYLERLSDYSLRLDVALPVFGWGIHIRNNEVVGLIRDVDEDSFAEDDRFLKLSDRVFEMTSSGLRNGHMFQKGDRVKIETIDQGTLYEMIGDIKGEMKARPAEVIFYDLDSFNLRRYKHEHKFFKVVTNNF